MSREAVRFRGCWLVVLVSPFVVVLSYVLCFVCVFASVVACVCFLVSVSMFVVFFFFFFFFFFFNYNIYIYLDIYIYICIHNVFFGTTQAATMNSAKAVPAGLGLFSQVQVIFLGVQVEPFELLFD